MSIPQPAAGPEKSFGDEPIRTGLKLRPEVHAYFRDRAHAEKISMQKLIESFCEAVYAARIDQEKARARRAATRKPPEDPS